MYHSLRSTRCASVFSFRARGAGTRKRAPVAPRLRLVQFGIQSYALRADATASNVAVRVYFCRLADLPRVDARPCGGCVCLKRALLRPSLSSMLLSLPFVCPLPNVGAVKPSNHTTTTPRSADVPRRCANYGCGCSVPFAALSSAVSRFDNPIGIFV